MTLREIRDASTTYFSKKITTAVSTFTLTGAQINVGDTFTFNISATNATAADGVTIKNVRYNVASGTAAVVLIVPPATVGTAKNMAGEVLSPGTEQNSYILTPATSDPTTLTAGETDTIMGLSAKAKAIGAFLIGLQVQGDIDLNYLFPADRTTPLGSRGGNVLE